MEFGFGSFDLIYRHYARVRCAPRITRRAPWCGPITHAITPAKFARALPGRRDGDIALYRHYARMVRTRITRALYIHTPSETLNHLRRGTCAKRGLCRQDSRLLDKVNATNSGPKCAIMSHGRI